MIRLKTNDKEQKISFLKEENLEFREYQFKIAEKCISKNSLIVIPTGLGKTIIATYIAAKTLELFPQDSKIIILAPTRPLINQHYETFKNLLKVPEDKFEVLTGKVPPEKRAELFENNQIIFYTPQTLRNDLVNKKYELNKVCLVVFDEAHHSSGDYPYTLIAEEYIEQNPDGNILALTASPGASKEKIKQLCKSLHISMENIHTRSRKDQDVKLYLKPMEIHKIGVNMSELMEEAYIIIQQLLEERLQYLSQFNFLDAKATNLYQKVFRKDLLRLNAELVKMLKDEGDKTGVYSALSINAQALILFHMLELIEQQGLDVLLIYLDKIKLDAKKKLSSKAVKILAADQRLTRTWIELKKNQEFSPEFLTHPKYQILEKIILDTLMDNPDSRILVFIKLRDSVKNVVNKLKNKGIIRPSRFVGQSTKSDDDKGFTQKKQVEILKKFKEGQYNVLISTNVGEEGLDIAECDLVIFYDVVASEIRFIQRRGRTARHRKGKVIILYCKGTHDEIYLNIALNKLKKMNINLKSRERFKTPSIELDHNSKKNLLNNSELKNKETQSSLHDFLYCSKQNSFTSPYKVKISQLFPVKFGLRRRLLDDKIPIKIVNSQRHVELFERVLIQINEPKSLISATQLNTKIETYKKCYNLVILIFDFVDFKEKFKGEERLLKKKVKTLGESYGVQAISIDNPEELYFIVRNIYIQKQSEEV